MTFKKLTTPLSPKKKKKKKIPSLRKKKKKVILGKQNKNRYNLAYPDIDHEQI